MTEQCALNGCKEKAGEWTMCDRHATSLGIRVRRPVGIPPTPKPARVVRPPRVAVHLPDGHLADLLVIINSGRVSKRGLARDMGISRSTLDSILDRGHHAKVRQDIAQRIAAWMEGDRKITTSPPTINGAELGAHRLRELTQEHINIARAAVTHYGAITPAARNIGLTDGTLRTWVKHKQPGDKVELTSLRMLLQWDQAFKAGRVSIVDKQPGSGPLDLAYVDTLRKAVERTGSRPVGIGIGISHETVERIIGGGNPPIHGKTAHKIARWVAAGCPTPRQGGQDQGGQDQQPGKFRPITQHHLDTLDRAVKITGSQVKASHALGISTGTMWRIMSRTPGRLASKWSLDRVDRWGEAHPAESSPDRMDAATILAFIRCLTAHLDVAEKTAA